MTTKRKYAHQRDYLAFYRDGMNVQGWCVTGMAIIMLIAFISPTISGLDTWVLQLLQGLGNNCVWCSVTPS